MPDCVENFLNIWRVARQDRTQFAQKSEQKQKRSPSATKLIKTLMSKVFVSKNVQTEITKKKSNFLLLQPEKLQGLEKIGMIDFRYSITYLVFGGKVVVVAGCIKKTVE